MVRLLITGASGQLGSEVQSQAKDTCVAVTHRELDITKVNDVQRLCELHHPDIILNCAAYTQVDRCEDERDTAFAVNTVGVRNIAIAAESIGAKLVHISTDYVFDGTNTSPYREYELPNPQSVYGKTKLAGEEYVRQFCRRAFVVRTSWLYGRRGGNFVKTILNAAKQGKSLKVVDDQIGSPTNCADLAGVLLRLVGTEHYGTYHITNNGECSWYEFACEFLRLSGLEYSIKPCTTAEYPTPASRPAYSVLDNMMLRLTIGDSMRNWREAIADFMSTYTSGGLL